MVLWTISGTDNEMLQISNTLDDLPALKVWVDEVCAEYGRTADETNDIQLVMEEAVVNVINYAYPGMSGMPVSIEAEQCGECIKFTIDDAGEPFDPTGAPMPDIESGEMKIGGLGILLIMKMSRNVTYRRCEGHNILMITI